MALAKLPKCFDLIELRKGYFPHFFNTIENQNYCGKIPAPEYYGYKYMSVDEGRKFLEWHKKQENIVFDFQNEIIAYCKSDVDILTKACLKFRKLFIEITKTSSDDEGVDPFIQCLTMPAACHYVFRRNFMKPDTIALIPPNGYDIEPSSFKSTLWLKYVSFKQNIYIQHSRNGKEKQIQQYKVDGWDPHNRNVYEFHGCVFHGCPKCFSCNSYNPLKNETFEATLKKHNERISAIKSAPEVNNLIEIWECEYDEQVLMNDEFANFIKEEKHIRPPLEPRNALSGGRTNAIILHHVGSMGYVDFTSLYPYIQKYGEFPIGHPKIITENFGSIDSYFGLIYCSILPPNDLYLPILPFKTNGKLLFPLCGKCTTEQMQKCNHSAEERVLENTWVILEVIEALKWGYKIVKIFEIWHFPLREKYNKSDKSGGLFTEYVNTFLRIKQESSGYPHWVETEADKDKYIDDYFQNEGIKLQKENIKENSGLKSLSKLLLNSQWGRYAMNTHKTTVKFIKNCADLNHILYNDQFEVKDVLFPTENVGICYYKEKKELHWGSNQTNVVLAAFVTAQARLKLYDELRKFNRDVVYFDTDSIFYKKGNYEPVCGDYLGMFTNEIDPKEGQEIVEFASAGPKNYTYKLDTGITHTKIKGFSLNIAASSTIDFQKIKEIVTSKEEIEIPIEQNTITRDKSNWTVQTKTFNKIYRQVYDKRIILNDLSTVPYGFKY